MYIIIQYHIDMADPAVSKTRVTYDPYDPYIIAFLTMSLSEAQWI